MVPVRRYLAATTSAAVSSATVSSRSTNLPMVPSVSFTLMSKYVHTTALTGTAPAVAKEAKQVPVSGVKSVLRNHLLSVRE